MTAGNEEERGEERRMEERGEENRRGAGTRCAEIKEIKENDFSKKRDNSWIEMQLEFAYVWWMCMSGGAGGGKWEGWWWCWWRVRIRDGWGGGLGVDGFQCSWKQLRKTQGPGSHSPNRLVSVTYSSQHLNLTPTLTHTETDAQTHTKWASLLKKEARLSVTPAFVLWGMAYMYVCVCVCVCETAKYVYSASCSVLANITLAFACVHSLEQSVHNRVVWVGGCLACGGRKQRVRRRGRYKTLWPPNTGAVESGGEVVRGKHKHRLAV